MLVRRGLALRKYQDPASSCASRVLLCCHVLLLGLSSSGTSPSAFPEKTNQVRRPVAHVTGRAADQSGARISAPARDLRPSFCTGGRGREDRDGPGPAGIPPTFRRLILHLEAQAFSGTMATSVRQLAAPWSGRLGSGQLGSARLESGLVGLGREPCYSKPSQPETSVVAEDEDEAEAGGWAFSHRIASLQAR
ncbi:unnamed protein product [Diplocarpon coronariae]